MRSKGASRKSQASSEGASEEDFSFAWNRLLDEIADDAQRTESYTGQTSFKVSVMQALADVPREAFVPDGSRRKAYDNRPLPIGQRQTISQPYIVTLVTDLLDLKPNGRVLEIGTGCGYQTAVLAALTSEIFSVEYLEDLHRSAKVCLTDLGCQNFGSAKATAGKVGQSMRPMTRLSSRQQPPLEYRIDSNSNLHRADASGPRRSETRNTIFYANRPFTRRNLRRRARFASGLRAVGRRPPR